MNNTEPKVYSSFFGRPVSYMKLLVREAFTCNAAAHQQGATELFWLYHFHRQWALDTVYRYTSSHV